jgi:DNA mismatch repair protein MSH4
VIYRKGNNAFLTTAQLIILNDKTKLLGNDIIRLSNTILCDMLLTFAKEIDVIYHLIATIIDLDIIQSLADVSCEENFCCPTFNRVLRLEDAYHPLLKFSRENECEVVKNNVIATPQYNFFLISGSNMSGKTVYIKMIAIIQIMAQIGCFVPAKSASIRMCDKIFSRLGFQDNIEQNASSFTVELRDMEYIYSNLTPNSLVVIDELCRSTNPQEGEVCARKFYNFSNSIN